MASPSSLPCSWAAPDGVDSTLSSRFDPRDVASKPFFLTPSQKALYEKIDHAHGFSMRAALDRLTLSSPDPASPSSP